MKTVCLLFLIGLIEVTSGFSQVPTFLIKNDFNWEFWEKKYPEKQKLDIIKNVDDELFESLNASSYHSLESDIDNFHFIDFDSDGDYDIIYCGFVGSESDGTMIFRNQDGIYFKILDLFGKVVEISRSFPVEPVSFKIIDYPCCEENTFNVESYVPFVNEKVIDYKLSNKLAYVRKTKFPNKSNSYRKLFKVKNEKYLLRSSPTIDNESNEGIGNVVAEYTTGATGYALAEASEETGRVWWFVVMINDVKPKNSQFSKGNNNNFPSFYLGWMSSRFLEEL